VAQAPSSRRPQQPVRYEILIRGQLDPSWSHWFEGLDVTPLDNGETLIAGPIPDQAALRGILAKVFDLGLSILSVRRSEPTG
jgi:hypothetical protein